MGAPHAAPAVRLALVAGGATPVRARAAEDFLAGQLAEHAGRPPAGSAVAEFGRLAAEAAPGDPYRRHATAVCAGRLLARALAGAAA